MEEEPRHDEPRSRNCEESSLRWRSGTAFSLCWNSFLLCYGAARLHTLRGKRAQDGVGLLRKPRLQRRGLTEPAEVLGV
jgi:hypothetical protein